LKFLDLSDRKCILTPMPNRPHSTLAEPARVREVRCSGCRTKIVFPGEEGLLIRNAILRVSDESGQASAKCPRCKSWVDVPLTYRA